MYGVWYHVPENHPLTPRSRDTSHNDSDNVVSETVEHSTSGEFEHTGARVEIPQMSRQMSQ